MEHPSDPRIPVGRPGSRVVQTCRSEGKSRPNLSCSSRIVVSSWVPHGFNSPVLRLAQSKCKRCQLGMGRFMRTLHPCLRSCRYILFLCRHKRRCIVKPLRVHPRVHRYSTHLICTRWPIIQIPVRRPILKAIIHTDIDMIPKPITL